MEPITLSIPFDPTIALSQHKLKVRLMLKKNLIKLAFNFVVALVICLFAWESLSSHESIGYFFLACGAFSLLNALSYGIYYAKYIRNMRKAHNAISELRERSNDVMIWEFRDDVLRTKDINYDNLIRWEAFSSYKIVDRNLLLMLKETVNQFLMLSERELSPWEYSQVMAFVKTKMPMVTK